MYRSLTHYITNAVARIGLGLQPEVYLPNLSELHEWCHEYDYMEATASQPQLADSYVIETGIITTIRDFVRICFAEIGVEIEFSGKDRNEKGVVIDIDEEKIEQSGLKTDTFRFGQTVVRVSRENINPENLFSNQNKLTWQPKYDLDTIVKDTIILALKANKQTN